jgi:hypothetical protein
MWGSPSRLRQNADDATEPGNFVVTETGGPDDRAIADAFVSGAVHYAWSWAAQG